MICRVNEFEILSNTCEQNESKLIALYGRRRIDKPYFSSLINSQKYAIWSGVAFEVLCVVNINLYLETRMTKHLEKIENS